MKSLPLLLAAAVLTLGAVDAAAAAPKAGGTYVGQDLAGAAKVSLAAARATALHARPGRITDQELEKEAGGGGLRYSFDIRSHGKTYEVGVDAKDGRVLENALEGKRPD